jgi:hypothetical protein
MLIAAAWYQVLARNAYGFTFTPLAKAALADPAPSPSSGSWIYLRCEQGRTRLSSSLPRVSGRSGP